ncbi:MAG: hypothetical protein HKN75_03940 [Bacteroidia bacterium]|nr:hypothetical protein [Bacteroidia bacterium]
MNRIIAILLVFSSLGGYAQTEKDGEFKPTTRSEYDFVTVGYQIQLNTGLPMKSGYKLVNYEKCEFEHANVSTKALFREGDDKPCAIMLIYSERFQKPRYFCVPTKEADEELWKLYFASLEPQRLTNNSWLQYMTYCAGNTIMEKHHKDYE